MEAKTVNVAAAVTVVLLVTLVAVLGFSIGPTRTFFLIAGIDFALILGILVWVLLRLLAARRQRSCSQNRLSLEGEELRLEYSFLRKVARLPTKFRYSDLQFATDNFSCLLGRGASASVFKAIFPDGTPAAVKRIDGGTEYAQREFRAEVAAIASVHHLNLVRLLGFCCVPGGAPRFLVYEFIPNGALDAWIFPGGGAAAEACLPWPIRYRVAIDVAKALAYLHHDCRPRVLHLDVKPENILLDEDFRARVTDFGLSKLMGRDESRVVTTIRGTRGYLAPEWLLENGISEKSDIYSYGMVLLELVGGRRNVRLVGDGDNPARKWSYFPRIVSEKVREGRAMEVVDQRLSDAEEKEVIRLVNVALWCIQETPRLRPTMEQVVGMLEGRLPVNVPPETEMIIVDLLAIDQHYSGGRGEAAAALRPESHCPPSALHSVSILSGR